MNVIKKYWNNVYLYILLLIPTACLIAGVYYTSAKLAGYYPNASWLTVFVFDFSQLTYYLIAFWFILHKKKVMYYSERDIIRIKIFITISLFIQYNFIMHTFPSQNAWTCTFIFLGIVAFLFDMKLMLVHVIGYTFFLIVAHILYWQEFVPDFPESELETLVYRMIVLLLTSTAFVFITFFVERFMMQEQEQESENIYLMEKQLEYYQNCDLIDKELRKFRHDIKGHFLGMEYLLEHGNYQELTNYFRELNDSFAFQEKLYFSGNLIIDSILNYDIPNKCRPHVNKLISGRLAEIHTVSSIDLCTLFSNMLSNAICAANQCCVSRMSQLSVRFDYGSKFFSITIINSTPDGYSMPDTAKNSHSLDRNHGYGIRKIKDICEKYSGEFDQISQNNKITTTVYLPL